MNERIPILIDATRILIAKPDQDSCVMRCGNAYRGNLTTAIAPGGTRCMYYNRAGTVVLTKDLLNHATSSTPDPSRNYAVPSAVTTGNLTSTMTWNGAFQPLTATNPNGATAGLTYDNYARPVSTTSPYGAVTYFYYSNSPATKTTVTKQRWAKTTMDGFGRSVKEEAGYGYGTSTVVTLTVAETQYAPCGCTPMGKTKQVSVPHAPNATAAWTTYNYDALGRTIGVVQPNNAGTTQYSYMGNTVTVTDPALAWKTFITDAMGNLTQVTEPNPAGGTFMTYYTYSTLNQLLTVSMPRPSVPGGGTVTQTRSFVYNSDQRLQSVTNPESGTTSYTYYPDGSLLTKTDAKGQVITYYYDEFGRLTQVKNGLIFLRTLTYDANGYGSYLNGRLARVDYVQANSQYRDDGNVWTEMYSYDPAGGMLKKKLTLAKAQNNPGSLEATWTYDDEGKMTSIKYPNSLSLTGTTYTYTFDSMGRPLSLSDGTTNIASGATYGPAGEMTALSYSGIAESRSYNDQKQLTGISIYGLGSIGYNYSATNNNGRIASMNNTFTGENVTYAYDSLNRLITATASGQWGLSFSYDGFGNRLSQTVMLGSAPTIQQSYDQTTNRQLGQTYDANGNNLLVVNYGALATYDVENRLITSNINSYNETYEYGIDNKRIYKLTPGTTNLEQVYFYAGGRKIATYNVYKAPDNNGNIWITFAQSSYDVYFGGKLIVSGGQGVVLDRLGSVVARYNGNNMYETHAYFPYGEERTTTANNRDKFGTYFRDASSGLDYADQRFYSSINARFLTADPYQASGGSEDPGSWNRYEYVLADPINLYDPEGLFASAGSTRKEYEDEVLKWERMNHAASGVGPYYWYYWNPGGVGGGGGGGGQVKGGGGGASSAAPPQSQTNDPCPADKRAFFNQMGIYKSMASDMDTNVDFIIGLSALETGWGTSPASKNGHNLFGASDYKEVPLSYSGYQASADAWETRWAKDVRGVKDARTFYTNLVKDQYNTHKGYVDVLLKMGHAVTLFKKLCGVT